MDSPQLKRDLTFESDCSSLAVKRQRLQAETGPDCDKQGSTINQHRADILLRSTADKLQSTHSELPHSIDITRLGSSVNGINYQDRSFINKLNLSYFDDKAIQNATPPEDLKASILSPILDHAYGSELIDTCFGMVCDANAQFINDPRAIESSGLLSLSSSGSHAYALNLFKRDNHIALQYKRDVDIAVLNTRLTNVLWAIEELGQIRYEAFVEVEDFSNSVITWANKGGTVNFPVEIIIFGNGKIREQIGKMLSDVEIYLQHPRYYSDQIQYDNPHFLEFSHTPKPTLQLLSPSLTPPNASRQPAPSPGLNTMLDNLGQIENLSDADIDPRVIIPLLSHQKTGVDFIGQKEGWRKPSLPSLWHFFQKDKMAFYEHIIVGTRKSSAEPETFGGILADEMGLGKTLTVLSAIVGSLARSRAILPSSPLQIHKCETSAGGTLIIVPSVLVIDEWLKEIRSCIAPNVLSVLKYHGPKRECITKELLKFDILLTTYATVASEFGQGSGPLYGVTWFRIVLDEAHSIRHHRTKQFRAITALAASYRWCLTGTPIQNNLYDLGALIRFLRVPLLDNNATFRDHIANPIESGKAIGFTNLRTLLKSVCLRRTKDLLQLPKVEEITYELELSPQEKKIYRRIGESSKQLIDDVVSGRKTMDAYNIVLQAIVQLRLLCNHGTFGQTTRQSEATERLNLDESLALLQQTDEAICAICSCDVTSLNDQGLNSGRFTTCSHLLCNGCFAQYEEDVERNRNGENSYCPICQESIELIVEEETQPCVINADDINIGQSTKLLKLLEDIHQVRYSDKSIIFSSWKKTLQLIATLLSASEIPFVQIDGSLSLPERRKLLANFQESRDIPVLLMTLGTGAVGLNITAATRIHIVEPQWNPAIEMQAIGRSVRLGQQKQVRVVRYILKNTVEEYIQSRQSRKLQLSRIGWDSNKNQESETISALLDLRSVL